MKLEQMDLLETCIVFQISTQEILSGFGLLMFSTTFLKMFITCFV